MKCPRLLGLCTLAWLAWPALAWPAGPVTRVAPSAPVVSESELKAAYLYNFVRFVRREHEPATPPTGPVEIAVLGDEALARALERLSHGKQIDGREIRVATVQSLRELHGFDVVFVGLGAAELAGRAVEQLRDEPVLTVGEAEDFAIRGGMIELYFEARKLRFEINAGAADRSGLKISSNLLSLASAVHRPHS